MARPKGSPLLHGNRPLWLILLAALAVRLPGVFLGGGLWYDELQSVTHAALPLTTLFETVRAFDPHPPLYYIQLHLWMMAGTSDAWIRLNSLLISLLTVASLFFIVRRLFDDRLAALAALFLALSPYSVFYAQEVRMYGLLGLLGLWAFHFTHRFLAGNRPAIDGPAAALFTLAFLYSHGAGFMLLPCVYVYAACFFLRHGPLERNRVSGFALLQILVLAAYYPWLRAAAGLYGDHPRPDGMDILNVLATVIAGFYRPLPPALAGVLVVLFFLGAGLALILRPRVRAVLLAFVFTPVAACLAVSFLVRSIWHYRALAVMSPFVALALAAIVMAVRKAADKRTPDRPRSPAARHGLTVAILAASVAAIVLQYRNPPYKGGFRTAAHWLLENAAAGESVYVTADRALWGLGWYLAEPAGVHPFELGEPIPARNGMRLYAKAALEADDTARIDWVVQIAGGEDPWPPEAVDRELTFDAVTVSRLPR